MVQEEVVDFIVNVRKEIPVPRILWRDADRTNLTYFNLRLMLYFYLYILYIAFGSVTFMAGAWYLISDCPALGMRFKARPGN